MGSENSYICKVYCEHTGMKSATAWHQKFLIVPRKGDVIERPLKDEEDKLVLICYKVLFVSHLTGKEGEPLVRIHCSQP